MEQSCHDGLLNEPSEEEEFTRGTIVVRPQTATPWATCRCRNLPMRAFATASREAIVGVGTGEAEGFNLAVQFIQQDVVHAL